MTNHQANSGWHDISRDVGEAEVASSETIRQAPVVDSQAMEDRGVQVIHMDGIAATL